VTPAIAVAPLLVAITLAATGCSRAVVMSTPFSPVAPEAIMYQDDAGGLQDSTYMAVTDALNWEHLWQRVTSTNPNPPQIPSVDFDREMLLIAAAGRMKAGDRIHVDSVGVQKDVFHAFVTITTACTQLDIDVFPLEIVRVPKTNKRVQFQVNRARPENCP
jgi:hypothetical protein